jgi:diacylglycerol kinase (ATP)
MAHRPGLRGRLASVSDALHGVARLLRDEPNARIHGAATLVVLALSAWLGLGRLEWALLVLAIGAVWTAEALNSAFEALCDAVRPEPDPRVARAKDLAAGGVLLAALAAAALGALVLGPPLLARLSG